MKITVFGCCRQESLNIDYDITCIMKEIAYCHNTKEMLEIIKYCKHGHIPPEDTIHVLRNPLILQKQLVYNDRFKYDLENSDIFVLEISSKMTYEYKNRSCHHSIYTENKRFRISDDIKNQVIVREQTFDEIYDDILKIKHELNNKPMIIVTHLVTINDGGRYDLACILEEICNKESILIINPMKQIISKGYTAKQILEPDGNHYNKLGHKVIKEIYDEYINKL